MGMMGYSPSTASIVIDWRRLALWTTLDASMTPKQHKIELSTVEAIAPTQAIRKAVHRPRSRYGATVTQAQRRLFETVSAWPEDKLEAWLQDQTKWS